MQPPSLFRHLAIIMYDLLLLIAILFLATALILPLNNGEAYSSNQYYFPLYVLSVSFFYFGWFWTHGGQTLGMKAWKTKVMTLDKSPMSWSNALVRFTSAILSWLFIGLGFLWKVFDKNHFTWHDHLSKTTLFLEKSTSS